MNPIYATREWVSSMIAKSLKGYSGKHDYSLPTASPTELGGVMVDDKTIKIEGGVIRSLAEGTKDYNALINKPSINGIQLVGDVKIPTGGTTVEGNPSGEATKELNKILIGDDIFIIPEGGGGSPTVIEQLYKGTELVNNITLNKSYKEFDVLIISGFAGDRYYSSNCYICKNVDNGDKIGINTDGDYCWYNVIKDTSLTKNASNGMKITDIYGIKYGSGGGSSEPRSETIIFNTKLSDAGDFTIPDITKYDAIRIVGQTDLGSECDHRTYIEIPKKDYFYTDTDYPEQSFILNNSINSQRRWILFQFKNSTTLHIDYIEYMSLMEIVGINYGSGGSGDKTIHEYSTEEQIVGKWIDGRNVYEKTFTFANKEVGGWTTLITDTAFSDYELRDAVTSGNSVSPYSLTGGTITRITGNNLEAYCGWGTYVDTIIIQYTKKSEKL